MTDKWQAYENYLLRNKTLRCAYCNEVKSWQAFPSPTLYAQCYECAHWCWSCNKPQTMPKNPFRVCGECCHVYRTRLSLRSAWWQMDAAECTKLWRRLVMQVRFRKYDYSCPKCAHDW